MKKKPSGDVKEHNGGKKRPDGKKKKPEEEEEDGEQEGRPDQSSDCATARKRLDVAPCYRTNEECFGRSR